MGEGIIELCEIPTDDEIHDNVVAMWVPAEPVLAGAEVNLNYRLHWLANEPYPSKLAVVWATRLGRGGQPGQPRPKGVRKFMVEFLGGPLNELPFGVTPELVVSTSRGSFGPYQLIEAVPDGVPGHGGRSSTSSSDRTGRTGGSPKSGRRDRDRDLDVPVPPVLEQVEPRPRSGGSRQVGELGVALGIRSMCGLATVAECLEIAGISGRPAACAVGEVDDGEFSVDRLLIGEIGRVRGAAVGGGDRARAAFVLFISCSAISEEACARARKATEKRR